MGDKHINQFVPKLCHGSYTVLHAVYPLLLLALVWEVAARMAWVRPLFLPAFSTVLVTLWHGIVDGEILVPLGISIYRAVVGVLLSLVVGVPIGFLIAQSVWLRRILNPFISVGFPTPKIAVIPVVTLWFGIDDSAKVVLVFVTCIFPFILSARAGAEQIPTKLLWAARSMGSKPRDLLMRVVLPATLPSVLTGLRIAFPIGLITVFTAEMVTGGGLGEAIVVSQRYFESAKVYAFVLSTMVVGYVADTLIARFQKYLDR